MKKIIVIVGPTAVGKTKLSIELAKKFSGEIINSDSTQIYKNLDIATAKIKEDEKEGIIHHLFDVKDIYDSYSVYDYQKDCRNKIKEIIDKNKTPILVGGTGLYIKAALYNYEFNEETEKQNFDNLSNEELYEKLISIEPNINVHKNNRKRVERILNKYLNNNESIYKEKGNLLLYDCIFIGLTTDRKLLYDRINCRVDKMIEAGLIEEADKLYKMNLRTKAIMTPIGYKELFDYFDKKISLQEAVDLIKQRSRRYAKRQYTWFKNQMQINWFEVDFENFNNTVEKISKFIENN